MKYDLCHHEKTVLKVQSYCILRAIHALSITAHVIYEWVLVKVRAVFFGLRWARQVILLLWWSGGMAQGQWCFLGLALSPTHKHHETPFKAAWKATQAKQVFAKAQDTNTEPSCWHWGLTEVRISAQEFPCQCSTKQQPNRNSKHVILGQCASSGKTREIKIVSPNEGFPGDRNAQRAAEHRTGAVAEWGEKGVW